MANKDWTAGPTCPRKCQSATISTPNPAEHARTQYGFGTHKPRCRRTSQSTAESTAARQRTFESAIRNGGEKLALAHKYLGGVYWKNNDNKRAADELEKYVTLAPQAPDVQKVRETIKELRSGTKHRDG